MDCDGVLGWRLLFGPGMETLHRSYKCFELTNAPVETSKL